MKKIKFLQLPTLSLLSLLIFCSLSAKAKEFVIGVEAISYYPLYDFSATDIDRPSFTKDILTAFFESHNYSYRFLALPIKRFDKWYAEKNIDFKFPDNIRWREDNKLNITFSKAVIKLMAGTYVLKSNKLLPRNKIKRMGTILGFFPTLWLDEIKAEKVVLIEDASPYSIVKHMLYNNIDSTNIDSNVIRHNLALLNREGEIVLNTTIRHESFSYHLSSIRYPNIIEEFNAFLKKNAALVKSLKFKYNIIEDFNS